MWGGGKKIKIRISNGIALTYTILKKRTAMSEKLPLFLGRVYSECFLKWTPEYHLGIQEANQES